MDAALSDHRLPQDITLWRGGKQRQLTAALNQGRDIGDLRGMVISDDAYLSASVNKDAADEFVKWGGKDAFEIEIQAPRGTYGAYIEGLDRTTQEYEYLLETDPFKREHRIINPRYHYKLAKLYQEIGEDKKAIEQYSRFLEIWQNAEQDLPEYIDSKKQLAVLKGAA